MPNNLEDMPSLRIHWNVPSAHNLGENPGDGPRTNQKTSTIITWAAHALAAKSAVLYLLTLLRRAVHMQRMQALIPSSNPRCAASFRLFATFQT